MARITIEDCINVVGNRFRLVMYGAQRGREIASGMQPAVEVDQPAKEKSAIIALREIVQGQCDQSALEQSIIRNHRRYSPIESVQEEEGALAIEEGETDTPATATSNEQHENTTTSASPSSEPNMEVSDTSLGQGEDKI